MHIIKTIAHTVAPYKNKINSSSNLIIHGKNNPAIAKINNSSPIYSSINYTLPTATDYKIINIVFGKICPCNSYINTKTITVATMKHKNVLCIQ